MYQDYINKIGSQWYIYRYEFIDMVIRIIAVIGNNIRK